ncbi:hypothetical protein D9M71_551030 [compost metagenome]
MHRFDLVLAFDPLDLGGAVEGDAFSFMQRANAAPDTLAQLSGQRDFVARDHVHLHAILAQCRGCLQADEAVTDDDHRLARLGCVEQLCSIFQ